MPAPTDLADRYGAPSPRRRQALIGLSVVVAAAFLGWLGWTIWDQSTPDARSDLVGYDVVDEHHAIATVEVRLADDDVEASCTLRAFAEDHSVVGELVFTPTDGTSEQDVRTERRATSVELLGCTTPDQKRPR
ncbi:DUF4307 domain-containing protein [Nocardioides sp. YIM 152315]|uniref:DUF4307 domain-containing protein n=1 Tax=Nocardioides sp. YIM 152315 TaxID=3031760 RepID=UPI0023DAED08|nr:DUF4307 domain-containing protein [Nocardioides sp. YIM 152315]MDF1603325.1 DUF4307 domain-containing protein [Nocardioides sp. YIM 152315]